jgi:hypothetical protein
MTSKARQKIDPQTRDMFDPEVDRPDHDKILTTLFADEGALVSLLTELHGLPPLPPFTDDSVFSVESGYESQATSVNLTQAVTMTGVHPQWANASPIRIVGKQLEVPMQWGSDEHGRYARLIGFFDIGVVYEIARWPSIEKAGHGKGYHWTDNAERRHVLIEVKSAWPTAGNLIRQLNLYKYARPVGLGDSRRGGLLLVGPDASMDALANEHHYRLVTFGQDGTGFKLLPKSDAVTQPIKRADGVF